MKLIIVESPTKCETIKKYLGSDYNVVASYGHIRDLSTTGKGGLGVNIEEDFKPTYVVNKGKGTVVNSLKKLAKAADEVYLATDPDREGEAISWHLADVLKLDVNTTKRLEFHEITKTAINRAINNPRTINLDLVQSQETRRIIDRIMGFKLSTLLKSKIHSVSAGRVQSVTLKLIVDREKEVNAFVPEEYWTINSLFSKNIQANLESYCAKKIEIKSEAEADKILNDLPKEFIVSKVNISKRFTDSKVPFRTSVLQQVAYNTHKFSTKVTQSYAQKLFEMGLITYIRTDGVGLAKEFIDQGKKFIKEKYGEEYLASSAKLHALENKDNSSMAHEAIRPTSLDITPEIAKVQYSLDRGLYLLYKLIYNRSLAAMMAPKEDEVTNVKLLGNDYVFNYTGSKVVFDGYSKVYSSEDEETSKRIPNLKEGEVLSVEEMSKEQHFTKGPSRFNEAKIVKSMEELGIGRPSTYASTIATLYARDYIKNEKGTIYPTDQGITTVENLNEFFPPFMETSYTAKMESELDELTAESNTRSAILNNFYETFSELYTNAQSHMEKVEAKPTGNFCPKCSSPLVYRKSSFGVFEGCSNYPNCKYKKIPEKGPEEVSDIPCPKCGKLLVKKLNKGKPFFACPGFPSCRYTLGQNQEKEEPQLTDVMCPKCGKPMLKRKGKKGKPDFLGCSGYPNCKNIMPIESEKE